jgi:hypothetical protein
MNVHPPKNGIVRYWSVHSQIDGQLFFSDFFKCSRGII